MANRCSHCKQPAHSDARFCDCCGARLGGGESGNDSGHPVSSFVVGTATDCDIVVLGDGISRHHAILHIGGSLARIHDLESTNGTSVDGTHVGTSGHRFGETSTIRLGGYVVSGSELLNKCQKKQDPSKLPGANRTTLLLGRSPDCNVVIDSPQVSAKHARATLQPSGVWLVEDLGSRNGTFVDGVRIRKPAMVRSDSRLSLGSVPVRLDARSKETIANSSRGNVRVDVCGLGQVVIDSHSGEARKLLRDISFSVLPSEFVVVMGPSGAGKTTLLMALAGYEPPCVGTVTINGEDFYRNFDRFRGLVGFVPQDDVLHSELTVREAVRFSARLRLPEDTTELEIEKRVDSVLRELNLLDVANVRIGSVTEKSLSGGQRKRVNLALELVAEPFLLFLDEPTSGLSSLDTAEVIQVLRSLSNSGRTVIMTIHQPSAEIYEQMNHVVLLAKHGHLAFFGPPAPDSYTFFSAQIGSPESVMARLSERQPEEWAAEYSRSQQHKAFVKERQLKLDTKIDSVKLPKGRTLASVSAWHQFSVLTQRYAKTRLRDKANVIFLFCQAPLVGLVLALLYSNGRDELGERGIPIFVMGIASLFFGAFNASREIVKERAIFRRERNVNLRIAPYIFSKFSVLAAIGSAQSILLVLIVAPFVGLAGNPVEQILFLILTSLAASALGLLVSTLVRSVEAAMAVVPVIVILHIVLGGFLKPLNSKGQEHIETLAAPFISRWTTEALMEVERRGLAVDIQSSESEVQKVLTRSNEVLWRSHLMQEPKGLTPHRLGVDALAIFALLNIYLASASVVLVFRRR